MRIFSDYHHEGLTRSLEMLFEGRLGCELYRPVGTEWFEQGYFKVAEPYGNCIGTVGQFLGTRGHQPDTDGIYRFEGAKWITLDRFKEMDIDIVIASIPAHIDPFYELISKYKPKAKLIFQIGNHFGDVDFSKVKNIMSSTSSVGVPTNVNVVFYHQEFDLNIYNYVEPNDSLFIRSFVHTLATASHFAGDWQTFQELEKLLPEYKFESYGAGCRDGCISEQSNIARLMKESKFGINLKSGGDGFGHVIHQYFACGRPVIIRKSQYQGKLAGELMIDGQTCIDLDKGSLEQNAKKIREMDKEKYVKMCQNTYKRFKEIVDFDEEQKKIELFLSKLV